MGGGWENFFVKEFCFSLDSKRDRRKAAGACGQLVDWRGPGRLVLPGRPGRLRRRRYRCLAALRVFSQASCNFRVSNCCTATAPVSHPNSLRNFPNGCQGHHRSHPPPSPHRIPNRVKQCSKAQQFLFNYWYRLTKNA